MSTPHVKKCEGRARPCQRLRGEQGTSTLPEAPLAPAMTPPVVPGELELTALSDLLAESDATVDYLVEERIACGSVALLAGKPKAGKSTAARGLALEQRRLGHVRLGRAIRIPAQEIQRVLENGYVPPERRR